MENIQTGKWTYPFEYVVDGELCDILRPEKPCDQKLVDFQSTLEVTLQGAIFSEDVKSMKRVFTASVLQEDQWFVAQCLEVDVASQGTAEENALDNLREALELHFEPPRSTKTPQVRTVEVEVGAP